MLMVASQCVQHRPAVTAIFELHENHEWRSGLAGNGLYHWDDSSLHRAPLHSAKCAYIVGHPDNLLFDGSFQLLHGRSSPNSEQTQDHCVCRQTNTKSCNALPKVCQLKPAHHLLSYM